MLNLFYMQNDGSLSVSTVTVKVFLSIGVMVL